MKDIIKIVSTQDYRSLNITFWPTDICNYNCPYCFPGSTEGKCRYIKNTDQVIQQFKSLFNAYNTHYNKEKFYISIAGGGEPTIWPDLDKFCKEIYNINYDVKISLITNGSRTLRWWNSMSTVVDKAFLSCHVHEADIEHLINVADLLHEKGTYVEVQVLMDALIWDKCIEAINLMNKSKYLWTITPKQIVASPGRDTYTSEQLKIFEMPSRAQFTEEMLADVEKFRVIQSVAMYSNTESSPKTSSQYINELTNRFFNWNCNISRDRIAIAANGDIKGSCGANFTNEPVNLLDNNLKEKIKLFTTIKCPRQLCNCPPDTHVTKWR